jgi:hypothetical protein
VWDEIIPVTYSQQSQSTIRSICSADPFLNFRASMQKQFVSTSTLILDTANPSTPPLRPSPPAEDKDPPAADPSDKRTLYEKLNEVKAKKQEAFEEAYKFSRNFEIIQLTKAISLNGSMIRKVTFCLGFSERRIRKKRKRREQKVNN